MKHSVVIFWKFTCHNTEPNQNYLNELIQMIGILEVIVFDFCELSEFLHAFCGRFDYTLKVCFI